MPLVPAKIIVVCRVHSNGSSVGDNKQINVNWKGGDPLLHPTIALFSARSSFSDLEAIVNINAAAALPEKAEAFTAAQMEVRRRIAGIYDLDSSNVFAAAHAWRDGRWVPIGANEFGFGFLIKKNGSVWTEPLRWGPHGAPTYLTVDFVVSIASP